MTKKLRISIGCTLNPLAIPILSSLTSVVMTFPMGISIASRNRITVKSTAGTLIFLMPSRYSPGLKIRLLFILLSPFRRSCGGTNSYKIHRVCEEDKSGSISLLVWFLRETDIFKFYSVVSFTLLSPCISTAHFTVGGKIDILPFVLKSIVFVCL